MMNLSLELPRVLNCPEAIALAFDLQQVAIALSVSEQSQMSELCLRHSQMLLDKAMDSYGSNAVWEAKDQFVRNIRDAAKRSKNFTPEMHDRLTVIIENF